ncbi:MAG: RluA family pseudouridine synthase [Sandaracinaceae bacterium]|nr:RluA family pseudouridine synthase [Sandaracinaceae bacterium]
MATAEFTVLDEEAGARLDVLLVQHFDALSRKSAAELAEKGLVRINGRRAKKSQVVEAGDVVAVAELPEHRTFFAIPNPKLGLRILFEDEDLVVVDKQAGVPSHPLNADEVDTVANALIARYPEMADVGYNTREPGLVHRLDTDTSGVLLAARNTRTFDTLRNELKRGAIAKHYIALVEGRVSAGRTIRSPLLPHPRDKKRVLVCLTERDQLNPAARAAETEIVDVEALGDMSLLTVHAPVAGRHQIRAHLASIGHPLVGDLLYGGPSLDGLSRHFLHAKALAFVHPKTHEPVEVTSKLPQELQAVVDSLRS